MSGKQNFRIALLSVLIVAMSFSTVELWARHFGFEPISTGIDAIVRVFASMGLIAACMLLIMGILRDTAR